jgi:hypothetical protein
LRKRLLSTTLKPYEVHGHRELITAELAIGIDISEVPDLRKDFLGQLGLHEETNSLVTSDQSDLAGIDGLKDAIEVNLFLRADQPISSRLCRERAAKRRSTSMIRAHRSTGALRASELLGNGGDWRHICTSAERAAARSSASGGLVQARRQCLRNATESARLEGCEEVHGNNEISRIESATLLCVCKIPYPT